MTTTQVYRTADGKMIQILANHIKTQQGGFKGICVSAVLSYFGVTPDKYHYTSSNTNKRAYEVILRRFGWNVRSRQSVFKKATTMGKLKKAIKEYSDYTTDVNYMVLVKGHLLLLNSKGETIVDTAPVKIDKRRVLDVTAVFK